MKISSSPLPQIPTREVSRSGVEELFAQEVVKAMRRTVEPAEKRSVAASTFDDMLGDVLSKVLVEAGAFGRDHLTAPASVAMEKFRHEGVQASATPPVTHASKWVRPIPVHSKISRGQSFGTVRDTSRHQGVDMAAPEGTPVTAVRDGVVAFVGTGRNPGNWVKIVHEDGFETRYMHLSSFRTGLSEGDVVHAGTLIGYVGSTGRSTGPHLHFELRQKNDTGASRSVDPTASLEEWPDPGSSLGTDRR